MPRVNVWIPDELHATVAEQLPGVNVSKTLQEALAGLLGCHHEHLVCRACSTPVDHHALATTALGRFYSDLLWDLAELVRRVGTAEGAARIARDVGRRHQIPEATRLPLPRPTRAERAAAKVTDLPLESVSRERHPTARHSNPNTKAGAA